MGKIAEWTQYCKDIVAEMKKVTFPSRTEVTNTTFVVIVASILFAVFLFASDQAIIRVYELFNGMFGV